MSKSNDNISDKMKDLQNKYKSNNIITRKDANLMVQMNLYDGEKVNNNILELEEVYDSQLQRLHNLKEEDPAACIEKCNNFLEDNNEVIHKQLDTIVDLEKNIKNVVEECDEIEQQEDKLNSMIKEPKYVELADKIKRMRSSVDNLNLFLVRKKISNYKN